MVGELQGAAGCIMSGCRSSSRRETREGANEVLGEIYGVVNQVEDCGLKEQLMDVAVSENVYYPIGKILEMMKERKENPAEAR
jgi:hypothetical protein